MGDTYKSLFQSHVSKIKSFLPVAAETSLTKAWTDGQMDGGTRWLQYSPLSTSGAIITGVRPIPVLENDYN